MELKITETSPEHVVNLENIDTKTEILEELLSIANPDEKILAAEAISSFGLDQVSNFYDKSPKYLRAALATVVFALGFQSSIAQEKNTDNVVGETTISKLEDEHFINDKEKLKTLLGYDVYEEAKKINRKVILSYLPDKPEPLTIVFLGQSHKTNKENNWTSRKQISRSQKEIAKFLSSVTPIGDKVFLENFSVQNKEFLSEYRLMSEFVDQLTSYKTVLMIFNRYKSVDGATKNKIAGEKLVKLGFSEVAPFHYKKDDIDVLLPETGFFKKDKAYQESSDVESNISSSTFTLYAKGNIEIEPTEETSRTKLEQAIADLNQKGKVLSETISSSGVDFSQGLGYESFAFNYKSEIDNKVKEGRFALEISLQPSNIINQLANKTFCTENPECVKFVKQIKEEDIPNLKHIIFSERETEAVSLIAKQAITTSQKVFPLVYGSAHDFVDAVKSWNNSQSEDSKIRFNLVTIKSDLDK